MNSLLHARWPTVAVATLLLGAGLAGTAQAQNAVITGTVTANTGEPLAQANVFITEMGISVGTNAQGAYTITIPAARVAGQMVNLRARIFGYAPAVRPVRVTAGSQQVNFELRQDVNRLAAVVVTGVTGATETRKVGFAVAQVTEAEMPVPASNPLQQLQGKVPGANIVSATGRPGTSPSIILRGPKSINASGRGQGPLIVVDGVVIQGTLADLNPQDIESVEVVRGAAGSSLYGSRAGSGVISITTKSGRNASEGMRFNVRSEYGISDIEREFPLAQRHFFLMDETKTRFCAQPFGSTTPTTLTPLCGLTVDVLEEALRINENSGEQVLPPVTFLNDAGISRTPPKGLLRNLFQVDRWPRVFDPVDQMVTSGQFVSNTVDMSGRSSGTSYFLSGAQFWQQGAIRYLNGFRRNSVRVNVDQNIGTDWTVSARTYYARSTSDGGNQENQGRGFFSLTRTPVGVDILRTDKFGRLLVRSNPLNQGDQNYNPAYSFQNEKRSDQADRFIGNLSARYTPLTWLDLDGNLAYDRRNRSLFFIRDRGYRSSGTVNPAITQGRTDRASGYEQSYNASLNATARRTWAGIGTRFTAGYDYHQQDVLGDTLKGEALAVPGLTSADAATASLVIGSSESSTRLIGFRAGAAAEYRERYILDGVIRRDGSSLFGSANRWANYGRVSAAWRASQEEWWILPQVNEFKLRASYGTAGGRPSFAAQYETFTIGTGGVLSPLTLGNKNLRPETTYETELGIDAEAFNRIGLQVTWAHGITKDQILPVPAPAASGFQTQWRNAGTLDNKTWELSLNVPIIQRRNLNWSTRVNYDRTRTFITKLDVPPFFGGTTLQATEQIFRFAAGERYATFYGRKFLTSCGELPSAFQAQCGTGQAFQRNNEGYIVWVGQGNTPGDGIAKNLWNAVLPAAQAPWGVAASWGMPIILRDANGTGQPVPLGNALPDYRLGVSQTLNWQRLFVYAQLDGAFGQYVWNQGRHWSLGDFMDREQDQDGATLETAKPLGYYWRATLPDDGRGLGGFYDFLGVNNRTLEKASYAKVREVTVAYNVGPVRGTGDWTISLIGRNLYTFTDYTGFDPEVGATNINANNANNITGSGAINATDTFQFPNTRTFTVSLSTRF
jgi:TonB-linked SusC/RagA family outer membrane protein